MCLHIKIVLHKNKRIYQTTSIQFRHTHTQTLTYMWCLCTYVHCNCPAPHSEPTKTYIHKLQYINSFNRWNNKFPMCHIYIYYILISPYKNLPMTPFYSMTLGLPTFSFNSFSMFLSKASAVCKDTFGPTGIATSCESMSLINIEICIS